ncbi:MAG: DUF2851 family protein [Bacteroidota bacterium]
MGEDFLHFIWKTRKWTNLTRTASQKDFEVQDTGIHNHDAGPDFFNAKIKTGGTTWAGNVEIHKKGSEWFTHHHHKDPAYNNVILHVVAENDKKARTQSGRIPETWKMEYPGSAFDQYQKLIQNISGIPCHQDIHKINPTEIIIWLQSIAVERLRDKASDIEKRLQKERMDIDTAFYQVLFKHFGFKVNQVPFEMLGRSLNWKILAKHRHDLHQIEALLFGQAGLLQGELNDDYFTRLKQEYKFLQKKYRLNNINPQLWKFSRMRPVNFPGIRLAQLSKLMYEEENLFSKVVEAKEINQLMSLFIKSASTYWDTHYRFGQISPKRKKKPGKMAVNSLIINAVIPFLFLYARMRDEQQYADTAISLLEALPPENNRIIREWDKLGINASNALDSQALIQLKNRYCIEKKCLFCNIGQKIITMPAHDERK